MHTTPFQPAYDLLSETLISFSQAAKRLPPGRCNKPVSPSTPFRWAKHGIRRPDGVRVKLECVRVGGRFLTSVEALARFSYRLTTSSDSDCLPLGDSPPPIRSPSSRRCSSDQAGRLLEQKGL